MTAQKAGEKAAGCATAFRTIALVSKGARLNVAPFTVNRNKTPPMLTVVGLTIRYEPSSTWPPCQSRDPNSPDAVKKCEWVLAIAPVQGRALVGLGLPGLKLLSPDEDVCPTQAWATVAPRPALSRPATSSLQVFTRCHCPTSGARAGFIRGAAVTIETPAVTAPSATTPAIATRLKCVSFCLEESAASRCASLRRVAERVNLALFRCPARRDALARFATAGCSND